MWEDEEKGRKGRSGQTQGALRSCVVQVLVCWPSVTYSWNWKPRAGGDPVQGGEGLHAVRDEPRGSSMFREGPVQEGGGQSGEVSGTEA